jgi:hypothetical protein
MSRIAPKSLNHPLSRLTSSLEHSNPSRTLIILLYGTLPYALSIPAVPVKPKVPCECRMAYIPIQKLRIDIF